MFKNILIPVDLSEGNQCAVDAAAAMAQKNDAVITLLHVIETIEDANFVEIKDFYNQLEKRATQAMDKLMERLTDSGLTVRQKIVFGNRAAQILQFAREHKIDLIVMLSHRINPEEPTKGWGTISHKVGLLSQCPVLLVK